jgi:hypothetical protein
VLAFLAARFVEIIKATAGREDRGVHPYCGPCDRHVFICAVRLAMSDDDAAELDGREVAPGVRTRLVKTEDVAKSLSDFVGLTLMLFYRKYSENETECTRSICICQKSCVCSS